MIRTVTILIMTVASLGSGTPRTVSPVVFRRMKKWELPGLKQAGFGENWKAHAWQVEGTALGIEATPGLDVPLSLQSG